MELFLTCAHLKGSVSFYLMFLPLPCWSSILPFSMIISIDVFRTFARAVGCDPSAGGSQLVQCLQVIIIIIIVIVISLSSLSLSSKSSSIIPLQLIMIITMTLLLSNSIPQNAPLDQLISHVRLFDHEDKVCWLNLSLEDIEINILRWWAMLQTLGSRSTTASFSASTQELPLSYPKTHLTLCRFSSFTCLVPVVIINKLCLSGWRLFWHSSYHWSHKRWRSVRCYWGDTSQFLTKKTKKHHY